MQFLFCNRKKKVHLFTLGLLTAYFSTANTLVLKRSITWTESRNQVRGDALFPHYVSFQSALQGEKLSWLPYWSETIRLNMAARNVTVTLQNVKYGKLSDNTPIQNQDLLRSIKNYDQFVSTGLEQGNTLVGFRFLPLMLNDAGTEIVPVVSFEFVISYDPVPRPAVLGKKSFALNSVLANGSWYKIAVVKTGFHRLDASFFASCGIDISLLDPRTIRIYGNGAGLLPQPNSSARPDDLLENAIIVSGEHDGVFNSSDYVLFYGKAQSDVWKYNGTRITREKNIYSDTTYYFLTFGSGTGKRIAKQSASPAPLSEESTHVFCHAHELDLVNPGRSGRKFLGEAFDRVAQQNFTVNIPGFIPSEPVSMISSTAARSYISSSTFDVSVNGSSVITHELGTVGTSYESPYYLGSGPLPASFSVAGPQLNIAYRYSMPGGGATGWLDYFEITARASLTWYDNQVLYRILPSAAPGNTAYTISGTGTGTRFFNVSNGAEVSELLVTQAGNQSKIVNNTLAYTEIAGIDNGSSFPVPVIIGKIGNQNLHALPQADALFITPGVFYQQVMRLAAYHQQAGYKIHVVQLNEIYNEFSSGAQDITAIRDFIRMFYVRSTGPADRIRFINFFGRASYDYKYRTASNSNFVPTYQSEESSTPLASYCSDDYFGLLDDNEGGWDGPGFAREYLDVAIGRMPISTEAEAAAAVDKIIGYARTEKQGNWRNKLVFVSDDEDNNIHQVDANFMADQVISRHKSYNVQKIWIDAYKEEVIAGGQRYPDAQKAITDAVQKGAFIVNYTGHGGELGWAAERILTIEDIQNWTNADRLPLFVTATCEFSRFDDPQRVSAGELTFLSTRGGAIGLFTTTRLVSAGSNTELNTIFYRHIGLDSLSRINPPELGEVMRLTKNDYIAAFNDRNERNFTFLGDVVMKLAYPKWTAHTTSINSHPVDLVTDTLKALSKVTVTGAIKDLNGNVLTSYNGELFPTVYDKPTVYQTLGNNPKSPVMQFQMQNNIIYSGSASVVNGLFSFSFIVPKDISYEIGRGKISYYAKNESGEDANGYEERFLVGGTADSVMNDQNGPDIRLFMNDEKFVFGGLTNESPLFIAKLYDESGINTVGRGVGRELLLTIDNETNKATPVNDYYQAQKDNFQQGEVKYRLSPLEAGKHTATLKAWDTYNNSSESTLDFVVASDEKMALRHVLNYPNPFTGNTTFHFDHNTAGENLTVMIQVYTISGKLARTLSAQVNAATSHFSDISWNGADDYGDKLAKGVYIYKVIVKSGSGKAAEATQKLVILN